MCSGSSRPILFTAAHPTPAAPADKTDGLERAILRRRAGGGEAGGVRDAAPAGVAAGGARRGGCCGGGAAFDTGAAPASPADVVLAGTLHNRRCSQSA